MPAAKDLNKQTSLKPAKKVASKNNVLVIVLVIVVLGIAAVVYKALIKDSGGVIPRPLTLTDESVSPKVASFSVSPTAASLPADAPGKLTLLANTGPTQVDGFQFRVRITGNLPDDLAFEPTDQDGLTVVANQIDETSGGATLTVALITSNPTSPFTSHSEQVSLGELTFDSPTSGNLSLEFDESFSKIVQTQTGQNILQEPSVASYSFE